MTFEYSILIAAPAEDLFNLTQDYARRRLWDRFLYAAHPLSGALAPDVGVRVRCVAWYGSSMDVEYVSYRSPRVAAVRMRAGPPILRRFAASWLFRQRSTGETQVTFRYHFLVRPAWLTRVVGWFFAREMRKRLVALKRFAESQRYIAAPATLGLVTE
jgi:hypothetical protein